MKKSPRVLIVLMVLISVLATSISAVPGRALPTLTQTAADAQVTPLDEEPDDAPGLGSIVGSPDAGPDPEDAGDRGGYAQLGLAVILLFGVAFIATRIVREARSGKQRSAGLSDSP